MIIIGGFLKFSLASYISSLRVISVRVLCVSIICSVSEGRSPGMPASVESTFAERSNYRPRQRN